MRWRKLAAFVLSAAVLAFGLVGCAFDANSSQDGTSSRPGIVIGSNNFAPFNYLDENGDYTGIDVEFAREAFGRMGYDVKIEHINWEDKDILLDSGEIDCVWDCYTMTGREDEYAWAGPYMKSRQIVAVSPGSDIASLADLKGKVVAVQATTKPEAILLNRTNPDVPEVANVYSLTERLLLFPSLSKGYVDAIAAHEPMILQYMEDYGVEYRILDESLLDVGLGVAFSKQRDGEVVSELNAVLDEMRADGTMERILAKYLDDPVRYLEVDGLVNK